jgi:radical SAM protein (TIGR01212 family)
LAYLQSFSNTHGPPARLAALLEETAALPDIAGLCLGTRPDVLCDEKIYLLSHCALGHVRLELGLQTANDVTLARINRGHDAACFAKAARQAAAAGLFVTAHVMAGLPGESVADFLSTIDFLNALPITGIKLHNCLVVAGAPLASRFTAGDYTPLPRQDYIDAVCAAIARLRPDIVLERLNADPAPGELVAPAWAADKQGLLREIQDRLERDDIRQGCGLRRPGALPLDPTGRG